MDQSFSTVFEYPVALLLITQKNLAKKHINKHVYKWKQINACQYLQTLGYILHKYPLKKKHNLTTLTQ